MKTTIRIITAALVIFSFAACNKDDAPGHSKNKKDFAAEGYSLRIREDGVYNPVEKGISLKETESVILFSTFEKHPGAFYPSEYGEVEYKITKDTDASVANVNPIHTGSLSGLGVRGVSEGNTTFTVEVTSTSDGSLLLRRTVEVNVTPICEAVDMGLSVMWAPFNVGAATPEECGSFFAWGETEKKEVFDWLKEGDYKWGVFQSDVKPDCGMTKYQNADGLVKLTPDDDAATANWGSKWRMPTYKEAVELLDEDKCTWVWDEDRNGVVVISKITSKSIFLPCGGYYEGNRAYNQYSMSAFWLANISEFDSTRAYYFFAGKTWEDKFVHDWHRPERFRGCNIRPVKEY